MKHGKEGKEVWPDGTMYRGDYECGSMHGKGLIIYSDNSMYNGDFYKGNVCGHGVFVWAGGKFLNKL